MQLDDKTPTRVPLPDEIQQLSESETACKFCGVSYLLLSRLEKLQNEFRQLEEQLCGLKEFELQRPQIMSRIKVLECARDEALSLAADWETNYTKSVELHNSVVRESEQKFAATVKTHKLEIQSLCKRIQDSVKMAAIGTELVEFQAHVKERISNIQELQDSSRTSILHLVQKVIRDSAKELEDTVHKANSQEIESKSTISQLQGEKQMLMAELSRQISDRENEVAGMTLKYSELSRLRENETKTLSLKIEQLEASQRSLVVENAKFSEVIEHLQECNQKYAAVKNAPKRVVELETMIQQMKTEQNDTTIAHQNQLIQLQNSFQERITKFNKKFEVEKTKDIEDLKYKLEIANALEKDLRQKAKIQDSAQEKLQWEYKCLDTRLLDLQNVLKDTENKRRHFEAELTRNMELQLKDNQKNLQNKINQMSQEFDSEKESLMAQHQADVAVKNSRISELENNIKVFEVKSLLNLKLMEDHKQLNASFAGKCKEVDDLKEIVRQECEERVRLLSEIEEMRTNQSLSFALMPEDSTCESKMQLDDDDTPSHCNKADNIQRAFEASLHIASTRKLRRLKRSGEQKQ